ncbi:uncharacterized protein LOC134332262 isoform X2 [Trichomycterus rosablanca]|uniref:uncharacterized protein LOC134332262 isoform X2 n=1 Tax=Trichomycterus rosablanca TaxID=2290929 RepID=UPI002F353B46
MASLNRQRSWQEDLSRNFFRLFSRTKSFDQDRTELQSEDRGEHEADSATSLPSVADSLPTPEHYLNDTPEAQTLEHSEQDRPVEGDRLCDHEGSGQGDAESDPPPITPPVFEPSSPVPPVDSFFRRLGSLFQFARAEPGGAGSLDQPSEEAQGGEDTQEAGEPEQELKVQDVHHSFDVPEVEATRQSERGAQDTRLREEVWAEQNGEAAINRPSAVDEEAEDEERRHALSCPPVVTYVTYHGRRKISKMRRSQEVGLHSPISEGEEAQHESGVGYSSSEEREKDRRDASAGASVVDPPTENYSGYKNVPSLNAVTSDYESHASLGSSDVPSIPRISPGAEGTNCNTSPSALRTRAEAGKTSADFVSDPSTTASVFSANEHSACDFAEAGISAETPQQQVTNTDTATTVHPADVDTASNLHTHLNGLGIDSNGCRDVPLSSSGPNEETRDLDLDSSSTADFPEHSASREELPPLGLIELDAKMLQLESRKLVEDILTNALAALERIDASDQETDDCNEGAKELVVNGMLTEVTGTTEESASLGQAFPERSPVHGYETLRSTFSDGKLGTRVQADGSRSTPSSGYESIAGSDTDIQSSMAMSNDTTSTSSGSLGTQELRDGAVIGIDMNGMERNSLSSRFTPTRKAVLFEEWEGPATTAPSNELLHQYAHNDGNISHAMNITSVQPGKSLSGVTNGQVQCVFQGSGDHFSVLQEKMDSLLQCAAKDNLESNKLDRTSDLKDVSPICNDKKDASQLESNKNSRFPGGMMNLDSKQFADENVSEIQSHAVDTTTEPHLPSSECLKRLELVSQGPESRITQWPSKCVSAAEPSFISVKACLASVIEDGETDDEKSSTCPQITLHGSDVSPDSAPDDGSQCFRAVKVFFCNVPDDESQTDDSHKLDSSAGISLERPGSRLAVSARPHLELPGTFAVISEEEETDTVFVNDTGPTLSPGSRRVKVYPFSLSPIYEEDNAREDTSRDDGLHVPPATEEEQRSVEQQASSILSLLQSVSERLQSSAFSGSEMEQDAEDMLDDLEQPQSFLRPLWDRYNGDNDDADVPHWESNLLLHQQLTGESKEPPKQDGASPSHSPRLLDEELEEKDCEISLSNVANTPFYEYLRSSTVESPSTESIKSKDVHSPRREDPTVTTVRETKGFGKVNQRPTLLNIYEGLTLRGKRRDLCVDVEDVKDIPFSQATIHAQRGCWLLYVERGYRGSCILLEEGQIIQTSGESGEPSAEPTFSVGSIRRLVKDDGIPEIHLYMTSTQQQEPVCLHFEADHIEADGPVHLSDLSVQSGCWVAYDGAGFSGNQTLLEAGGLTTPLIKDFPISCVRSLRPVRMEGLRVQRPLDPKILVFEKPLFQGQSRELLGNTPSLGTPEEVAQVSSVRVTGGVWVGYSGENYRGQQRVLEEGEYSDCTTLFSEPDKTLKSFRFLRADFIEPAVCLNSQEEQMEVVDYDVEDLQQTGLMNEANTIDVMSGVWVAYSGKHYTGEQCVLEKGQHAGRLDWGGRKSSPLSIRPVRKTNFYIC